MTRKAIKPRSTKANTSAAASRRTQGILDALDLTHDTRSMLQILRTLLVRDSSAPLLLEDRDIDGLSTWLGLIDDNLLYIAMRIDPDRDPGDSLAAYAVA